MLRRIALLLFVLLCGLALAGRRAGQETQGIELSTPKREAEDLFRQVATLVETRSADEPPGDTLLSDSLDGMLHGLDPHSNYYSPQVFKDFMEDQEGKFSGLGMLVAKPSATSPLLVVTPIPETPASKAGIRAGDVILEVDGEPTDKMSSREAVRKLKGPEGTPVTIKLGRGDAKPELMTLKRAPIPKHTVPYGFLLDDGVGYVKINTFGQTTVEELRSKLVELLAQGMTSLILDLRDNPGGSLQAAVGVASLFLQQGQEVVSVRGRKAAQAAIRYRATGDGTFTKTPLVVMINLGSASASEIVAGALQDHDRAQVVGERSWGKGLVQTLTPLGDDGAVAITTARYYTPSGRLIQRDYSRSYDAYYFPDQQPEDVVKQEPKPEAARTDRGKTVYGGGGIAPDVEVKADKIPPLALTYERARTFLEFMAKEAEKGPLSRSWVGSDAMVAQFKAYVAASSKAPVDEKAWKESEAYIRCALSREAMTMLDGQGAGYRAMIPMDNQLLKAEEVLTKVPALGQEKAA